MIVETHQGAFRAWTPERASDPDPTIYYMPCPDHEAAIEVEGYCPCFDGLEIDWTKTDIWRNE